MRKTKIAIVYDWIDKWGGVERMLLTLHEIYPKADFYTSFYDSKNAKWAKGLRIHTSFMQNLPDFVKQNRILSLPFFPFAFWTFNFDKYDLVISVTSSFAKGIKTNSNTKHICILLTPTRFLWSHQTEYVKSKLFSPLVGILRKWDLLVSKKPDRIIAISRRVANRTRKYYGRTSNVIYPPFDTAYWKKLQVKAKKTNTKYYLVVGRLEKYKKIDLVIRTFNRLGYPLIVIGKGTQEKFLKKIANGNIVFLKNLTDQRLATHYRQANALIMPQDEDFGYTALEAQYIGCPVITYHKSGATESILINKTGITFDKQNELSLMRAIERFEAIKYNVKNSIKNIGPRHIRSHFDKKIFKKQITNLISKV